MERKKTERDRWKLSKQAHRCVSRKKSEKSDGRVCYEEGEKVSQHYLIHFTSNRVGQMDLVCVCLCVCTATPCSVSDRPPNPCYDKSSQHSAEECATPAHHVSSHLTIFLLQRKGRWEGWEHFGDLNGDIFTNICQYRQYFNNRQALSGECTPKTCCWSR